MSSYKEISVAKTGFYNSDLLVVENYCGETAYFASKDAIIQAAIEDIYKLTGNWGITPIRVTHVFENENWAVRELMFEYTLCECDGEDGHECETDDISLFYEYAELTHAN
jgi:hypothetical protein